MGLLKDEERQFMVVDKDSGHVYDLRNERHVERLSENESKKSCMGRTSNPCEIAESKSVMISPKSKKGASTWSTWWQKKKASNDALLHAAE